MTILIRILILICMSGTALKGQNALTFSVFNNATKLPLSSFSAVWNQPLHPGICIGYEFEAKEKSSWIQAIKAGMYDHQFAQTGIQLYYHLSFRKTPSRHFFYEVALSAGYLHSILHTEQAKLNSNGDYEIKNGIGRAQALSGISGGIGYTAPESFRKISFYMNYQFWLQFPFVPGYVPLLPNGSVHVGIRVPLKVNNK